MNALFGDDTATLKKGTETITVADLKNSGVVGIYFSAHWCPPCRTFTPQLVKFYNNMKATGRKFEIVFVSSDHEVSEYNEYYGEMPWAALPFGDARVSKLSTKFKVRGIPKLVLVDAASGKLIQDAGRAKVTSDPEGADFPWQKPRFTDIVSKLSFSRHEGGTVSWSDLSKMDAVGIYFSAHWCGPCRAFTPQLVKTYNKIRKDGKKFEIIFASSDRDAASFSEYWGEMPWAALPFDNRAAKSALSEHFGVEGIPTFVIVDPKTGKTISANGRSKVMGDKEGAEFPWLPKPCEELGAGPDVNDTPILTLLLDGVASAKATELLDTFQAFAATKKESWGSKAEEGDDPEYPIDFGYGTNDTGLVQRIRGFCNLTRKAPVLFILDVPARKKFMIDISSGTLTSSQLEEVVAAYQNGSLPSVGIKASVA